MTVSGTVTPIDIAGHRAVFDAGGLLEAWAPWSTVLEREMHFYQSCPKEHAYPRFVFCTFLDGDWRPHPLRTDSIPATQLGMGILSYLKYYRWDGARDGRYLATACAMGDYLIRESLTPDYGAYPSFTRSTGKCDRFPQPADAGCQGDRPHEIEPDKGGIAGYALMQLAAESGIPAYAVQGLHNARVLAANQQVGDAFRSPFPFRADFRDGTARGPVSGNMVYVLRLYDSLLERGYAEFAPQRAALWRWIQERQIPSADADGGLFAQFFEDHETPTNRTAWAPLNLARYLLEKRGSLDLEWRRDCERLLDFVGRTFTHREFGTTVCHEQDEDGEAWGGANSTYGAVLAMYAKSIGSTELVRAARAALNFTLYCVDEHGRPRDLYKNPAAGGWQEDAHTDVIHNYIDAMTAFPEWRTLPA